MGNMGAIRRKNGTRGQERGLQEGDVGTMEEGDDGSGGDSDEGMMGQWPREDGRGTKGQRDRDMAEEAERAAQRGRERCGSGRQRPNGAGAGARGLVRGDAE